MRVAQLIESGDAEQLDLLMKLFAAHLSKLFPGVELKTDSSSYRRFVDINIQPPGGKKGVHYQGSGGVYISTTSKGKISVSSIGGSLGVQLKEFGASQAKEALRYAKELCQIATEYANEYPVKA